MHNSHNLSKLPIFCGALFLIAASGCTSFRSTIMNRYSNDVLRPQSETRTARGVPVKLKVPTHMEVKIVETYYLGTVTGEPKKTLALTDKKLRIPAKYDLANPDFVKPTPPSGALTDVEYSIETKTPEVPAMFRPGIEKGQRVLNVETNLVYTDKVFTVDFPRPFAGTLSLTADGTDGITFDAEQYFATIRGSYKEETLSTINSILGDQLTPGQSTSAAGETVEVDSGKYKKLTRVVAFDRFDINECNWEEQMQAFVEQHLGACNPPCSATVCPESEFVAPPVHSEIIITDDIPYYGNP